MKQRIHPRSVLSAVHDGEGWCIKAERHGEAPFYFGGYPPGGSSSNGFGCLRFSMSM